MNIKVDIVVPAARPRVGASLMTPGGAFSLLAMAQKIGQVSEIPIQVSVHHEEVSGTYDVATSRPDILLLSYLTSSAQRAYELSLEASGCLGLNGKPISIVHGGVHATCLSEESLKFANIVVRGEVTPDFFRLILEKAWTMDQSEHIITRLSEVPTCIERVPIDWSRVNLRFYHMVGVQTCSGCPFGCSFCVAPKIFGSKERLVPLAVIKKELETIPKRKMVAVIDDNFLQSNTEEALDRCLDVARLIHDSGHRWVAELTTRTLIAAEHRRKGFIRQLARLGCIGLYFGLESVSADAVLKKIDDPSKVLRLLRTCQARGVMVLGAFVLGLSDSETLQQVKKTLAFAVRKARLDYAQFTIKFPPPGSSDWIKALKERALISLSWEKYEGTHGVLKHPKLSTRDLEAMVYDAYKRFYGGLSIAWRLLHPGNFIHPIPWLRRMRTSLIFNFILWRHQKSWHPEGLPVTEEPPSLERLAELTASVPFEIGKPDGISVHLVAR